MAMEVASQVASEEQPEAEARLGAGEVASEGVVVRVVAEEVAGPQVVVGLA